MHSAINSNTGKYSSLALKTISSSIIGSNSHGHSYDIDVLIEVSPNVVNLLTFTFAWISKKGGKGGGGANK